MSPLARFRRVGLMFGVLLCSLWADSAFAWQSDASTDRGATLSGRQRNAGRRHKEEPQDAAASLAKRVEQEKDGRDLFVRDWSKPESQGVALGDGLGPMYNAVSCVACHQLGGIGGAGKGETNVRLLHLVGQNGVPLRSDSTSAQARKKRQEVHPNFQATTSVMLHRHERNGQTEVSAYQDWLVRRLPAGFVDPSKQFLLEDATSRDSLRRGKSNPLDIAPDTFRAEGLPVRITERNTTSLFGAGLIDTIPDAAIVEQAERQRKHAPLITGRVPQNARGAVSRFGWRGQIASLREFVMTACAAELGLTVPNHQQARTVMLSEGKALPFDAQQHMESKLDLTQQQCDALIEYVAGLPAPQSARGESLAVAKGVQRGQALFEKIGCAICHVPDVGPVQGLYSDLLLHDMGSGLSDPLPAVPELSEHTTAGQGGYSGFVLSVELVKHVTTNIHQEWRTPPLWGVGRSAPYLHDGRAVTLQEAIQWHGGEGQRAAEAFRTLKPDEQIDLLFFLQSLTAPSDTPSPLTRRVGGGFSRGGSVGAGGGGFF